METVVKVVFCIFGLIFAALLLSNTDFSLTGGSRSQSADTEITSRDTYVRSYDANSDGIISDEEYTQGELNRIELEVEELEAAVEKATLESTPSPYADMITLSQGNTHANDEDEEYVVLRASSQNATPLSITGWKLKSLVTKKTVSIGTGVAWLEPSRLRRNSGPIMLAPGETATVISGNGTSISTSHLTNMCIGYLDGSGSCPSLENENLSTLGITYNAFDDDEDYDECLDAIESMGSCEDNIPDQNISRECRSIIKEFASYEGCYTLHKNDPDFLGSEWKIFLNARRDMWRNEREAIALMDQSGLVVDIVTY